MIVVLMDLLIHIRKCMQQKNSYLPLIKKQNMKSIKLLLTFSSISLISFGQQKIVPKSFKVEDTFLFNNSKHFQTVPINQLFDSKIVILPLDNMPCLVSNEKLIAPIPNALIKNDVVNTMPNPFKK
jgi:hypothetical protein